MAVAALLTSFPTTNFRCSVAMETIAEDFIVGSFKLIRKLLTNHKRLDILVNYLAVAFQVTSEF
jgi:hypothetical protein